jgi:hypothetical protein
LEIPTTFVPNPDPKGEKKRETLAKLVKRLTKKKELPTEQKPLYLFMCPFCDACNQVETLSITKAKKAMGQNPPQLRALPYKTIDGYPNYRIIWDGWDARRCHAIKQANGSYAKVRNHVQEHHKKEHCGQQESIPILYRDEGRGAQQGTATVRVNLRSNKGNVAALPQSTRRLSDSSRSPSHFRSDRSPKRQCRGTTTGSSM